MKRIYASVLAISCCLFFFPSCQKESAVTPGTPEIAATLGAPVYAYASAYEGAAQDPDDCPTGTGKCMTRFTDPDDGLAPSDPNEAAEYIEGSAQDVLWTRLRLLSPTKLEWTTLYASEWIEEIMAGIPNTGFEVGMGNVPMPEDVAQALGANSVVVHAGSYAYEQPQGNQSHFIGRAILDVTIQ